MLGREGMHRVADFATLNANYLMVKLSEAGFDVAFPGRRATHEFIVTLKQQQKDDADRRKIDGFNPGDTSKK